MHIQINYGLFANEELRHGWELYVQTDPTAEKWLMLLNSQDDDWIFKIPTRTFGPEDMLIITKKLFYWGPECDEDETL